MPRQFIVDPQIKGDLHFGTEGDGMSIHLGRVAETGPARRIWFSGSKEFVGLIIGKRGSGKSYTLGTLIEGLATKEDKTSIAVHKKRHATLLLDPMGNFWTMLHPVRKDGPDRVKQQWEALKEWDCKPEDVNVSVWLPAGFKTDLEPSAIVEYRVRISDLDAADLADLVGINLLRDAQGAALLEAFEAVTQEGWSDSAGTHPANPNYTFADLAEYLDHQRASGASDHAPSTLRALIRSLRNLQRQPVFCGSGTPLTELLVPGKVNILMLPFRVGTDLRKVITRLLIRRIFRERETASQLELRLQIETLTQQDRQNIEQELSGRVPASILAIDEAQELLGEDGGEAREALEAFCLQGRNYGLSMLLATQRPMAAAISSKVRAQVDVWLIHKLLTQEDIAVTESNLLAVLPKDIRDSDRTLNFAQLVRTLDRGQVIVSASNMWADGPINRIVVGKVRPRITVHGGEVS